MIYDQNKWYINYDTVMLMRIEINRCSRDIRNERIQWQALHRPVCLSERDIYNLFRNWYLSPEYNGGSTNSRNLVFSIWRWEQHQRFSPWDKNHRVGVRWPSSCRINRKCIEIVDGESWISAKAIRSVVCPHVTLIQPLAFWRPVLQASAQSIPILLEAVLSGISLL